MIKSLAPEGGDGEKEDEGDGGGAGEPGAHHGQAAPPLLHHPHTVPGHQVELVQHLSLLSAMSGMLLVATTSLEPSLSPLPFLATTTTRYTVPAGNT